MKTQIFTNRVENLESSKRKGFSKVFRWKIGLMLACLLWAGSMTAQVTVASGTATASGPNSCSGHASVWQVTVPGNVNGTITIKVGEDNLCWGTWSCATAVDDWGIIQNGVSLPVLGAGSAGVLNLNNNTASSVTCYISINTTTKKITCYSAANNPCACSKPNLLTQPSSSQTETICSGGTFATNLSVTTGTGWTYKWYRSTSSTKPGSAPSSGELATTYNYTPSTSGLTLGTNYYYYCVVTDATCETISDVSGAFKINSAPSLTQTVSGKSQTICAGDNFSNTYQMTANSPAGSLTYQWYRTTSTSAPTTTPAGGDWLITGSGTNGNTYTPSTTETTSPASTFSNNNNYYYYCIVTDGSTTCKSVTSLSGVFRRNNAPSLTQTVSGKSQTICAGDNFSNTYQMTANSPAGSLTYQWYRTTSTSAPTTTPAGGDWLITGSGTNGNTYTPSPSETTSPASTFSNNSNYYYYCIVTDGSTTCKSVTSLSGAFRSNSAPSLTQQVSGKTETICAGESFSTSLSANSPAGSLTYQWYRTTSSSAPTTTPAGGDWLITGSGTNGNTYTPNPNETTSPASTFSNNNNYYYYCIVTDGSTTCKSVTSLSGIFRRNNAPSVFINPSTICEGASDVLLSPTSGGTWSSNVPSVATVSDDGTVTGKSASAGATGVEGKTTFTFFETASGCSSTIGTLTVKPSPVIDTDLNPALDVAKCKNVSSFDPLQIWIDETSVAYHDEDLSFQWYYNNTASTTGGTSISSATNTYYPPNNATGNLYYYCIIGGKDNCSTTSDFSGLHTVNDIPAAPTAAAQTFCGGTPTVGNLAVTSGDGEINWYDSSKDPLLNTVPLTSGTYHAKQTVAGGCQSASFSDPVSVTVYPTALSAGTVTGSTPVCYNQTVQLTASGASGGSGNYKYQWQSSPDGINSWTEIGGSPTTASYTTGALTNPAYYYRYGITNSDNSCGWAYSASKTITVTPRSIAISGQTGLTAFNTCITRKPAAGSFVVTATCMDVNITVAPPSGFEIAVTASGETTQPGDLDFSTGNKTITAGTATAKVWVRPTAVAANSNLTGNVTLSASGISNVDVAVKAVINPTEFFIKDNLNQDPIEGLQFTTAEQQTITVSGSCLTGNITVHLDGEAETSGYEIAVDDGSEAWTDEFTINVNSAGNIIGDFNRVAIAVNFPGGNGNGKLIFEGGGVNTSINLTGKPLDPELSVSVTELDNLGYLYRTSPSCTGAGKIRKIYVDGKNLVGGTTVTLTNNPSGKIQIGVGSVSELYLPDGDWTTTGPISLPESGNDRNYIWVKLDPNLCIAGDYIGEITISNAGFNDENDGPIVIGLKGVVIQGGTPCTPDAPTSAYGTSLANPTNNIIPGNLSVSWANNVERYIKINKADFPVGTTYVSLTIDATGGSSGTPVSYYVESDIDVRLTINSNSNAIAKFGGNCTYTVSTMPNQLNRLYVNEGTTFAVGPTAYTSGSPVNWTLNSLFVYNRGTLHITGIFSFTGSNTFVNVGTMLVDQNFTPTENTGGNFSNHGIVDVTGDLQLKPGTVCLAEGSCFNVENVESKGSSTTDPYGLIGDGGLHVRGNAIVQNWQTSTGGQFSGGNTAPLVGSNQNVTITLRTTSKTAQNSATSIVDATGVENITNWGVPNYTSGPKIGKPILGYDDSPRGGCANCFTNANPTLDLTEQCVGDALELTAPIGGDWYDWEVTGEGEYTILEESNPPVIYVKWPATANGPQSITVYFDYRNNSCTQKVATVPVKGSGPLLWTGVGLLFPGEVGLKNNTKWTEPGNWEIAIVSETDKRKLVAPLSKANTTKIIPSECTDVYLREGVSEFPTLVAKDECKDIYFGVHTSIAKIHHLIYKKAYVDMTMPKITAVDLNWHMISAPLKDLLPADYGYKGADYGINTFVRYFSPKKVDGENFYEGDWTKSIPADNTQKLQLGMGYAFRYSQPEGFEQHVFQLPKLASSDDSYRFIVENEFDKIVATNCKVPIHVTDLMTDDRYVSAQEIAGSMNVNELPMLDGQAGAHLIIGNPFMSHLDLHEFFVLNKSLITGDVKRFLAEKSGFETHQMILNGTQTGVQSVNTTGEDDEEYRYVPPMQSFFVKLTSTALGLNDIKLDFNPEIVTVASVEERHHLRSLTDTGNRLRLQAVLGTKTSISAIVTAVSGASNGFHASEDAQKLISKDAAIELYTFAGIVPSDINMLNADSLSGVIVPIGIRAKTAGKVTLSIKGATGFTAADNIWLVDSKEGMRTSLLEREIFEFDLPAGTTDDRFFLCFEQTPREIPGEKTDVTNTEVLSDAVYVSITGNMLSVLSKVEPLEEVAIYDLTGRIVYQTVGLNVNYFSHRLPNTQEVYMVKAVTGTKATTKKVIVK